MRWGLARLADGIYQEFGVGLRSFDMEGADGSYPWAVGFLLGQLSLLIGVDSFAARAGFAHLCFLLRLVPWLSGPALQETFRRAGGGHRQAVRAYRAKVQVLREQGKKELERLKRSGVGAYEVEWSQYGPVRGSDGWPLDI